jgi:hypothetical protein
MNETPLSKWESPAQEWYSEEAYDSSSEYKTVELQVILSRFRQFGKALTQVIQEQKIQGDFTLTPFVLPDYNKKKKHHSNPAHSMAPNPRARIFDHRGRKRY